MPSLSSITRPDPVAITVLFGGETVNVTFDRNAMTQRWMKQLQQGIKNEDVETAAKSLADLITDWDITNDDGTPLPTTADTLAGLPLPFLHAIDEAIGEAGTISSAEGNASSPSAPNPSSDSTPSEMSSPNGSDSSTSPTPSASPSST